MLLAVAIGMYVFFSLENSLREWELFNEFPNLKFLLRDVCIFHVKFGAFQIMALLHVIFA